LLDILYIYEILAVNVNAKQTVSFEEEMLSNDTAHMVKQCYVLT